MSKSIKKYPVVRQERVDKKQMSRKFRHNKDRVCYKGAQYKKLYVCDDWHYRWTREDAIQQYFESSRFPSIAYPTLDSWLEYWERHTKRK